MAGNATAFQRELKRAWEEQREEIAEIVALIGLECLVRVVRKSPVDTGRFKGKWVTSIAAPSEEMRGGVDKRGGVSLTQGAEVLSAYPDDLPVIYIQNNLPYANRLENGWSKQAPKGMVGLTVAEVARKFDGVKL